MVMGGISRFLISPWRSVMRACALSILVISPSALGACAKAATQVSRAAAVISKRDIKVSFGRSPNAPQALWGDTAQQFRIAQWPKLLQRQDMSFLQSRATRTSTCHERHTNATPP